jgi:hypothetical protein
MRIFTPLRDRAIARLWTGQLLSAVGDELNRVATIWFAARLWGANAGRLMALHAGCALVASIFGGVISDRASFRRVLVSADVGRAAAVLSIPVGVAMGFPLPVLLIASIAISASLSALFDPALRAFTLELIRIPSVRGATNALMESTVRFARVTGPGLIAIASGLIPTLHFFSLDAVTFALSALSIVWIGRPNGPSDAMQVAADDPARAPTLSALAEIWTDPLVRYAVLSGAVVGAVWWMMLPLGLELLLMERGSADVGALANVMFAYGVGNLASNLLVANFADGRPERLLFLGRLAAGAGFALCALAPGRASMMAATALAATGGPLTDVGHIGMLQARYGGVALARVYRANLALGYAALLVLYLASPMLFRACGAVAVVCASAIVIAAGGVWGLIRFRGDATGARARS